MPARLGYVQNHTVSEAEHEDGDDPKYFDLIDEFFLEDLGALAALGRPRRTGPVIGPTMFAAGASLEGFEEGVFSWRSAGPIPTTAGLPKKSTRGWHSAT